MNRLTHWKFARKNACPDIKGHGRYLRFEGGKHHTPGRVRIAGGMTALCDRCRLPLDARMAPIVIGASTWFDARAHAQVAFHADSDALTCEETTENAEVVLRCGLPRGERASVQGDRREGRRAEGSGQDMTTAAGKAPTPYSSLHIREADRDESEHIDPSNTATIAACTIAGYLPHLPPTIPPHGMGAEVPKRVVRRYVSASHSYSPVDGRRT